MHIGAFGEEDVNCFQGVIRCRDKNSVNLAPLLPPPRGKRR